MVRSSGFGIIRPEYKSCNLHVTLGKYLSCQLVPLPKKGSNSILSDSIVMGENVHSKTTIFFWLYGRGCNQQKPEYYKFYTTNDLIAMSNETISSTKCKGKKREFSRLRALSETN